MSLGINPRPDGCRKLAGASMTYRIRVGQYHVVYTVEDAHLIVEIVRVGHRSSVYRACLPRGEGLRNLTNPVQARFGVVWPWRQPNPETQDYKT